MATLTEALINAGLSSAQANIIAARFGDTPPSTQAFQEALILAGVDAEAAVLLAANIGASLPEAAVGAASFDSQGRLLNPSGGVALGSVAIRRQQKRLLNIALLGDSRSASASTGSTTRGDWLTFAIALSGAGARIVLNAGVSGDTTAQAAARVQQVIDSGADVCTLLVGTNDNGGWSTQAQVDASLAVRRSITNQLTAAGVYVVSLSEMPGPGFGAGWHDWAVYFNRQEAEYWAGRTDGEFVDVWSRMTIPSSGLGNPSYFRVEGFQVHPNTLGSWRAAQPVAEALRRISNGRAAQQLVSSFRDTYATNPRSRNIHPNGTCQGTAGTIGAGNSGQLPSSFVSDATTNATCAYSVVARSDECGNDMRAVVTATSGQQMIVTSALAHALFVPNSQWRVRAEVTIESASQLNELSLSVSTSAWTFTALTPLDTASGISVSSPVTLTVESLVHTVSTTPAWAIARVVAKFTAGQSGAATFRVGRFSVERVDAPIA